MDTGVTSLKEITSSNSFNDPVAIAMYESISVGTTGVTENAIMGEKEFMWSSLLKNSAAASLSIATFDMHMTILNSMYEAVMLCEDYANDPDTAKGPFTGEKLLGMVP